MTIDERLDRLTLRHEALAESLELLRASVHEQGDNIRAQGENFAQLFAEQRELHARQKELEARLDQRVNVVLDIVTKLATAAGGMLGHITSHESRIGKLEGAR